MPGLYRDEGVILRTIKLGEADRIVTIFTRENGKIRAVAKGVRKTKSRFGGRLEPYTRVDLQIYKGRRELDTITGAHIVDGHTGLHRDFDGLASAAVMSELVEKIVPDREALPLVYELLVAGLDALCSGLGGTSVLPAFMVKLLSVSGFNPELYSCAGCGAEAFLGGFSPSMGGAVCETCWRDDPDAIGLSPDRLEMIGKLLDTEFGLIAEPLLIDEITGLLSQYTEYHLERPIRSMQLLRVV